MRTTGFVNGTIYQSWGEGIPVEALVIRGERVAWSGERSAMPSVDRIVDLKGAVLGPGLTDAHAHYLHVANSRLEIMVDQADVKSIDNVLERLRRGIKGRSSGEWAVAAGFDENRLQELRYPSRNEIDAVFPDRAVLIRRFCGHVTIANSAALAALGIDDSVSDPAGGVFGRDPSGRLDGSAREAASGMITRAMPRAEFGTRVSVLGDVLRDVAAMGIVAGVEAATGGGGGDSDRFDDEVAVWNALRQNNEKLPIRLGFMYRLDAKDAARRKLEPWRDPNFQAATLKFFADGIMGARTAAVSHEYADGTGYGLFMQDEAQLRQALIDAHCAGWQIAVHAVGDRAIALVVDAYSEGQRIAPRPDARHRIEHASCSSAQDYMNMRKLGVSIVTQPSFLSRMNRSKRTAFGDRVHGYYQARTIIEAGVRYVPSSDAPTGSLSPWDGVADAMDRGATTGEPIGPNEALPSRTVLAGYAEGGAFVMGQETWRGRLLPGMAADMIVLDRDVTTSTPKDVRGTKVLLTMVDGHVVHDRMSLTSPWNE